jgi:hypothetical protein
MGENEGRRQERVEGRTEGRKKKKKKISVWKVRKFKEYIVY